VEPKLTAGNDYSTNTRNHEVGGLVLASCVYGPGLRTPRHSHENAYFGFVLDGAYTEHYRTKSLTFERLTVAFHPLDESHQTVVHNALCRLLRIEIGRRWVARAREHGLTLNKPQYFRGGLMLSIAARLYQEFNRWDEVSPLTVEGLALEMLGEFSRAKSKLESRPPRWLETIRDILHSQFSERLTLATLAQAVNVNPSYLARTFRRHHQCTIGEYVRRLRVQFACHQLTTSDLSLVEIALAAGFCAQSHFSYLFKLQTGLTPTEYRETFR